MAARRSRGRARGDGAERLLEAAEALVAERGYAATGVAEVCTRAGVARTALYWHFGSKEELLAAVIERVGRRWIEEISKRVDAEAGAPERLDRLLAEWRRVLREEPQLIRLPMVAMLEMAEGSDRVRGALRGVLERAEAAIVERIEATVGRTLPDLDRVARTTMAGLQAAVLRGTLGADEASIERDLEELRRTIALAVWVRLPADAVVPGAESLLAEAAVSDAASPAPRTEQARVRGNDPD